MGRHAVAVFLVSAYLLVLALAVTAISRASTSRERQARTVIERVVGRGWLAEQFLCIARRETGGTFDPRSVNWRDRHSDGSRGSFGLFQIGAIHRGIVGGDTRRLLDPWVNAQAALILYRRDGLAPWGGGCR